MEDNAILDLPSSILYLLSSNTFRQLLDHRLNLPITNRSRAIITFWLLFLYYGFASNAIVQSMKRHKLIT